ncbi:hypothetical protein BV20DRAFT_140123 [Pilatotrama ljubarskyi]|nr:hypothetical protein BV20DRAFT_140123 [Pilatotrama ljubarskyi]
MLSRTSRRRGFAEHFDHYSKAEKYTHAARLAGVGRCPHKRHVIHQGGTERSEVHHSMSALGPIHTSDASDARFIGQIWVLVEVVGCVSHPCCWMTPRCLSAHLIRARWARNRLRRWWGHLPLLLSSVVIWHPYDRLASLGRVEKGLLHLAFGAFRSRIYAVTTATLLAHLVRVLWREHGRASLH